MCKHSKIEFYMEHQPYAFAAGCVRCNKTWDETFMAEAIRAAARLQGKRSVSSFQPEKRKIQIKVVPVDRKARPLAQWEIVEVAELTRGAKPSAAVLKRLAAAGCEYIEYSARRPYGLHALRRRADVELINMLKEISRLMPGSTAVIAKVTRGKHNEAHTQRVLECVLAIRTKKRRLPPLPDPEVTAAYLHLARVSHQANGRTKK